MSQQAAHRSGSHGLPLKALCGGPRRWLHRWALPGLGLCPLAPHAPSSQPGPQGIRRDSQRGGVGTSSQTKGEGMGESFTLTGQRPDWSVWELQGHLEMSGWPLF